MHAVCLVVRKHDNLSTGRRCGGDPNDDAVLCGRPALVTNVMSPVVITVLMLLFVMVVVDVGGDIGVVVGSINGGSAAAIFCFVLFFAVFVVLALR